MKEVLCICDFVEDNTEYWSEGCYYEWIGTDGEDYLIRTNFNAEGRVYAEDFDQYFKNIEVMLERLYSLTEKESEGVKLSEAECAEYLRLVDELHDLDVEIPFGIEI